MKPRQFDPPPGDDHASPATPAGNPGEPVNSNIVGVEPIPDTDPEPIAWGYRRGIGPRGKPGRFR